MVNLRLHRGEDVGVVPLVCNTGEHTALGLKTEEVCSWKTLVSTYKSTRGCNPEDKVRHTVSPRPTRRLGSSRTARQVNPRCTDLISYALTGDT
jgi:hypothetical protein